MENEMDATIQGFKSQALYGSFSKWGYTTDPRDTQGHHVTGGLQGDYTTISGMPFLGNFWETY